jgi:hypothetical protein
MSLYWCKIVCNAIQLASVFKKYRNLVMGVSEWLAPSLLWMYLGRGTRTIETMERGCIEWGTGPKHTHCGASHADSFRSSTAKSLSSHVCSELPYVRHVLPKATTLVATSYILLRVLPASEIFLSFIQQIFNETHWKLWTQRDKAVCLPVIYSTAGSKLRNKKWILHDITWGEMEVLPKYK